MPRVEVDHWIDLKPDLLSHLAQTSQTIGKAIHTIWNPEKIALYLVGVEVPHVHFHVSPIWNMEDIRFDLADTKATAVSMNDAADRIRIELKHMGCDSVSE